MAHVPFRADINEVAQGNAVRWNAAEEFYNNQGTNITLQHMSARHIIVFPSANITVTLPNTNTLLDGWQVHVGFPFSTADNPYEITVKDAAGAEWRRLIKGQWCECVKKGGSWYVYPPGSVADTGTVVPGTPPPQPPTVPSGTALETLNPTACPRSSTTGDEYGGFINTPSTVNGYVRKIQIGHGNLANCTFVFMTASLVGTTFTKKERISGILPFGVAAPNCYELVLATPIPIAIGDYVGFFRSASGSTTVWNNTNREILITSPSYYRFTGNPLTANTGTVNLTNLRITFRCTIEA